MGGSVLDGLSAWNCRRDENTFLYPFREKSVSAECFLKAVPIPSPCTVEIIYSGTYRTGNVLDF